MEKTERRETLRVTVEIPVNYSSSQQAVARNISIKGMNLITTKMMTKGTVLFLIIILPDKEIVKVVGEVRWSRNSGIEEFENGIEFFFMDKIYRDKISHFVDAACKKQHECFERKN
jgi:hypothetical protein